MDNSIRQRPERQVVKRWFETNQIEVMKRPAQSPDLNPNENLWHQVELSHVYSFSGGRVEYSSLPYM